MNPDDVVDKTEAGLHEVKTKARRLPPRLRSLLIMVDGRQTVGQLRHAGLQLGAPDDFLQQLQQQGLVSLRAVSRSRPGPVSAPVPFSVSTQASHAPSISPSISSSILPSVSPSASPSRPAPGFTRPGALPSAPAPLVPAAADPVPVLDGPARFRAAQKLMNDTVADAVGVRAVFFTLKLERCFNAVELLALLPQARRLLEKARTGAGAALEAQVRALLS